MVEFSDCPVEIHQMIVERCDFLSRFNLRSTSKAILQIVDSSKFYIEELTIDLSEVAVCLSASILDGQYYTNRKTIKDLNSMEIATKWMGSILKNAEIEVFKFNESSSLTGQFLQKFIEHLRSPLKVIQIDWRGKPFPNFFDKNFLEEVNFFDGDKSDVTGEFLEFLKDIGQVSIHSPIDVTDEYVLSMNSTLLRLESDNFTPGIINQLVDKFIARGTCSYFEITNEKEEFTGRIRIPDGFVQLPNNPHMYSVIADGKFMQLYIGSTSVSLGMAEVNVDSF